MPQSADPEPYGKSQQKRKKKLSSGEVRKRYIIWHRRFHYIGPEKLRHLHKVIKLKEKIRIPTDIFKYEVYKLIKIRNRTSRKLSPQKDTTLVLIYIDAYGLLPKSLRGNYYFGQIVDSVIKRVQSISVKSRVELIIKLRVQKIREETVIGHSI